MERLKLEALLRIVRTGDYGWHTARRCRRDGRNDEVARMRGKGRPKGAVLPLAADQQGTPLITCALRPHSSSCHARTPMTARQQVSTASTARSHGCPVR